MDKKIVKKSWPLQKILLICGGFLVTGFVGKSVYTDAGKSSLTLDANKILVDTVHRGTFQETIPIQGIIEPIKTVFIDAIDGGKVEEIFVEDGAMVKKGSLLMKLSNPDLQLSYLSQESNIVSQINQIRSSKLMMEQQSLNLKEQSLSVDYQINILKKELERNRQLYDDNVISKVEFQDTEDQYRYNVNRQKMLRAVLSKDSMSQIFHEEQMEQSLDLMKRNLDIAKLNLENLQIRSPISGQISGLNAEVGELISKGENIAQIDNLSTYKVKGHIDEYYINRIFLGQEGTWEVNGKTYKLVIKKIYPDVNNGTFDVDMHYVSDFPQTIKRGQSLSIKLELSAESKANLIAKGGFYQSTGGNWVYVLNQQSNSATKRNVKLGRQNQRYYEVLEGLTPGDVVLTSNYDNFNDKDELVLK